MKSAICTNTESKLVKVWDPVVRIFHWSMISCFFLAYILVDQRSLHRGFGYIVAALVCLRLIWGFIGSKHARFSDFVPSPTLFFQYLSSMAKAQEPRTLGHNPAGAAMIIALLLCLVGISVTGYMMGMDQFFGVDWVEITHKNLVTAILVLIVVHIAGVIISSLRHKENLVKSMVTGYKRS